MQAKLVVALAIGLVVPGFSLAMSDETGFGPLLQRSLDEAGISIEDLPDPVPLRVLDLETGAVETDWRGLDDVLAWFEGAEADGGIGDTHRVVGDVEHQCFDGIRLCYKFYLNALGPDDEIRIDDAQPTYTTAKTLYDGTPADDVLAFPVHGANVIYVQGKYIFGKHTAADATQYASLGSTDAGVSIEDGLPGSGTEHPDRAILGAGAGHVFFFAFEWGVNKWISFGKIRAHGVWTLCETEFRGDCDSR